MTYTFWGGVLLIITGNENRGNPDADVYLLRTFGYVQNNSLCTL